MHLDPLHLQVLPRLGSTGSSKHAEGVVSLAHIRVGHRHFELKEGIAYDVNLTNTGEAILLSGSATATLSAPCDRCLEPAEFALVGEIQGYYLFEPLPSADKEQREVYELVDGAGRIDIAPPTLAAIVFELPAVVLCRPDCEGITGLDAEVALAASDAVAPARGQATSAACADDAVKANSPFAALKDFKIEG